jgi:hypothetical protein
MNQPPAPSSSSRLRLLAGLAQVALLSLSSLACATEPVRPMKTESSAELFTQIKTLIGDAACDSQDQCHTIAVGHKACGGPGSYLAWSSKNVDAAKLNELVRRQAAAEQAENQRAGMISDCRLVTDPGAVCRAGRCQLQTGDGTSAGPQAQ